VAGAAQDLEAHDHDQHRRDGPIEKPTNVSTGTTARPIAELIPLSLAP
jgi:hypothetical protein